MSQQSRIRDALLQGHDQELYRISPEFHHSVDFLVAMLPNMVDGLAEGAKTTMVQREVALRKERERRNVITQGPPNLYFWAYYPETEGVVMLADRNSAEAYAVAGLDKGHIVFEATRGEVWHG